MTWPILKESKIKKFFKRLFKVEKSRENTVLDACGCICICPKCNNILNDQATWKYLDNEGLGEYNCKCGYISRWDFDMAPVPILMENL